MTPEQPHLDSIASDPDADFPKLVYADWLEERGRIPEAEAWRWIVTNGKKPDIGPGVYVWWLGYDFHDECDHNAAIGPALMYWLRVEKGVVRPNRHTTELGAYRALVIALTLSPHIRRVKCIDDS